MTEHISELYSRKPQIIDIDLLGLTDEEKAISQSRLDDVPEDKLAVSVLLLRVNNFNT